MLLLHIGLATSAQHCDGVFTGRVTDESGDALTGAVLVLTPGGKGTVADATGSFRVDGLCPGTYTVRVYFLGYEESVFEVEIVRAVVSRLITLTEVATQLQEIVVQHHDEMLTEHATNYALVEGRELERLRGNGLAGMLSAIPGVTTLSTGPAVAKPVIHGLHSNRILILNHGIRQEGQQWGAEHAPEIDPFIASNLVVIKDASAIKYGPGALGGVIVVNPPALPEQEGVAGSLNTIYQSNGRSATIGGILEGGVPRAKGWGWRVQGSGKIAGDAHTPDYHLTNTGQRELNFSVAAGYHGEDEGFDIYLSRVSSSIGILKGTAVGSVEDLTEAMRRSVPLYTTDFSYDIGEPRQRVAHHLAKVNGHFRSRSGEWRLQYGFQHNTRQEFDIRTAGLSGVPAMDLSLKTHTLDTDWETIHSKKRTVAVGVNLMYQDNDNIQGTQRIPFIPDFNSVSAGAFAVAKVFLNDLTLDLGARLDYRDFVVRGYDFRNALYGAEYNFLSPSATVGGIWKPRKGEELRLGISSAWRPPQVSELFSLGTHQSTASVEYGLLLDDETNEVRPASDLKAERALKAVITYSRVLGSFVVEITPFANYLSNYLYLRPYGVTTTVRGVYPYFRYRQTDALFVGGDFAGHLFLNEFTVMPKASFLWARDVGNDDILPFVPPSRYEILLRYDLPFVRALRGLYVESSLRYIDKQRHAPRVLTVEQITGSPTGGDQVTGSLFDFAPPPDGYTLVDLGAGISLQSETNRLDLRIALENLLDVRYRDYTNRLRYYADEVGRNFVISMKYIF